MEQCKIRVHGNKVLQAPDLLIMTSFPLRCLPPLTSFLLVTMVLLKSIAGLSLASIASASPLQLIARQNASSPCAAVAASVATQTAVAVPTVPAQLAYDCITSVPFNQSAALALVDGIVPYVRWQSTTAYLKDPPEKYVEKIQDAVDIWGELEKIRAKVEDGAYENEFEVRFAPIFPLQSTR